MTEDGELFDRALLRRRRARFAGEMAEHEVLLAHVAAEIADRVSAILREFPLALDLGAYHGVLGRAVAALPSVGEMIYAESVPALAALCPRPAVVCDEELLPFKEQSLNLVVSGLALHRVNDLPGALIQIRRALRPDGLFMAAALGSRSLHELREALIEAEAELHGGASPRVAPFADVREYGALLQRAGFALPVTDAELLTVTYPSPRELMREIRALGGGNVMAARRKMPLPRGTLERAEEIYRSGTRHPGARSRRASKSSISRAGRPMPASRSRLRRGARRRASPMRCTPPNIPPATRRLFRPEEVKVGPRDLTTARQSSEGSTAFSGSSAGGMA